MSNETARNFGFPATTVAETDRWLVLVRPKQPTFGSLVLVCKDQAHAFSDLSPEAFADLQVAVAGVERLLRAKVDYQKINYLMLMMVDPDVHFHVIPRYSAPESTYVKPRSTAARLETVDFPDAEGPSIATTTSCSLDMRT
mgnify:CR=1 FL=1